MHLSIENFTCPKEHITVWNQIYIILVNSMDPDQLASLVNNVDPDQLASEEASW